MTREQVMERALRRIADRDVHGMDVGWIRVEAWAALHGAPQEWDEDERAEFDAKPCACGKEHA